MKKFAALAALALTVSAGLADAQTRVGFAPEPYPPFWTPDASGNWSGWEYDFAQALCKAAGLECVMVPTAWDGIIPALNAGQIDVIINSMSITEERLKVIDFSDKYYNTPTAVIGAKGDVYDATPEGLAGKILGVQVATIHQAYAEKHFGSSVSEIKTYQTQDEANQDLVAGRIDAVQADTIILSEFLETAEGQGCCDLKGNVADDPSILGMGVGVGLRKGEDDLKAALNKGIAAMRADGSYDAITKSYFAFDIYGE